MQKCSISDVWLDSEYASALQSELHKNKDGNITACVLEHPDVQDHVLSKVQDLC